MPDSSGWSPKAGSRSDDASFAMCSHEVAQDAMNSPRWPLSFNLAIVPGVTAMFNLASLPERLDLARSCGFSGVEGPVPSDLSALRKLLDERSMRYVCLSFARGRVDQGELGITALRQRTGEFREELHKVLEAAQELGCRMIHPLAGRVAGHERASAREVYLDNLRLACEEAGRFGVDVIVEPICAARQPDFYLHTQAQALDIMASVGASNLRIMADMFHAAMSNERTSDLARRNPQAIGLLQVSHAPQRCQPRADDPELHAVLSALAAQGWRGWVSGEYVPQGELAASLAWTRSLQTLSHH